ncbi:MAG: class I SAM-dependent methyltransferase [Bacteroidota bacterium]
MNIIDRFHNWRRKLRWNKQYRNGRWDNLNNEIEKVRYLKIKEFIGRYAEQSPKILDLGSGEGVLNRYLTDLNYESFTGIDFSSVSIKKANQHNFKNAAYHVADLHDYTPDKNYNVIIFNEAFYYIHNSEKENVMKRVLSKLDSNGILISSIYREGHGCWEYFDRDNLTELDFETVTTKNENTYWKIGAYRKS